MAIANVVLTDYVLYQEEKTWYLFTQVFFHPNDVWEGNLSLQQQASFKLFQ